MSNTRTAEASKSFSCNAIGGLSISHVDHVAKSLYDLHGIDDFLQLHLVQYLESTSWSDLRELYVMMVELLLHDLLQYPKSEDLCLLQLHLLGYT
jgi:hypothetical protein